MNKKVFDIDSLSKEEVQALSVKLGEQVRDLCDKAVIRANKILNKYGLESKMAFQINQLGGFPDKPVKQEKQS